MADKVREEEWAEKGFGGADLGDKRLAHRLVLLVGWTLLHLGKSFCSVFETSPAMKEAAYRFIRNSRVRVEMLVQAGAQATVAAASETTGDLLVITDTTGLSFDHRPEGVGDLGGIAVSSKKGFFCHSSLVVDAWSGAAVGLVDQMYWARPAEERGKRHDRREREYEEKESFKWEASIGRVREKLKDFRERTIWVSDRESDVYEYLMELISFEDRFIVRASRDRALVGGGHLFEAARAGKLVATGTVQVPPSQGVAKRTANVEIRSSCVTLAGPLHRKASLPPLEVNVVIVREVSAPEKGTPLQWVLLTKDPVDTAEQSLKLVRYYARRWSIEVFHKAWKTGGGQVEGLQMQTAQTLLAAAALLAQAAVGLLILRDLLFDGAEELPRLNVDGVLEKDPRPKRKQAPATAVLTDIEWMVLWAKVEKSPLPPEVPPLTWAANALARLGGWPGGKRRPGFETLWRARHEVFIAAAGALLGFQWAEQGIKPPSDHYRETCD